MRRGRAGDRQDPRSSRELAGSPTSVRCSCSRDARPSSSETYRSRVFLDALDDYLGSVNPRPDRARPTPRGAPSSPGSSRRSPTSPSDAPGRRPGGALPLPLRRPGAAREPRRAAPAAARPRRPPLGRRRVASSCVSHLVRHPAAAPRSMLAVAIRSGQMPARLAPRSTELIAIDRFRDRAAHATSRGAGADRSACRRRGERRRSSTAQRRQPVLRRAARPRTGHRRTRRTRPAPPTPASASAPRRPDAVTAAIDHELGRLGEHGALMLRGAAIVGEGFDPGLAAAAAGLTGCRRSRRWTSCSPATWCGRTDVPRRFRFRHPIVRQAVYASRRRAGSSAPTSASPRRSPSEGPPQRLAPTTSSSPRRPATRRRSRC